MKNIKKFDKIMKEKYIELMIEYGKDYVKLHYELFGNEDTFEQVFNSMFDEWVLSEQELKKIKDRINV